MTSAEDFLFPFKNFQNLRGSDFLILRNCLIYIFCSVVSVFFNLDFLVISSVYLHSMIEAYTDNLPIGIFFELSYIFY